MAASSSRLDLKSSNTNTDRGEKFWNSSVVVMKFFEGEWLKRVRDAKNRPNYGIWAMWIVYSKKW